MQSERQRLCDARNRDKDGGATWRANAGHTKQKPQEGETHMVHGVINVRKEKGMTSFGVVSRMRRIFNQKKIGHTGTLDPEVEGVLVICMGKATKLVDDMSRGTKTYRCTMLLGRVTDTQDLTGTTLRECEVTADEEEVRRALLAFSGKQMQTPPMYSAVKVNGRKLVDLARRGIEVERKAREVEFSGIGIEEIALPRVTFHVTCSHGAYIRTLCHDVGEALGCGACMASLVRTRVEEFRLEDAHTLAELEAMKKEEDERNPESMYSFVIPIDHFYRTYPACVVKEAAARLALNGVRLDSDEIMNREEVADTGIRVEGELCGGGEIKEQSSLRLYTADASFIGIFLKRGGKYIMQKHFYVGAI